jgi:uncharacterized protein (DUF433 family)
VIDLSKVRRIVEDQHALPQRRAEAVALAVREADGGGGVIALPLGIMKTANVRELISVDPEVLGGCPVFKGTRVPVESLIWHLEKGATLDDFLSDFPSVTRAQASGLLELVGGLFSAERIGKLYDAAA